VSQDRADDGHPTQPALRSGGRASNGAEVGVCAATQAPNPGYGDPSANLSPQNALPLRMVTHVCWPRVACRRQRVSTGVGPAATGGRTNGGWGGLARWVCAPGGRGPRARRAPGWQYVRAGEIPRECQFTWASPPCLGRSPPVGGERCRNRSSRAGRRCRDHGGNPSGVPGRGELDGARRGRRLPLAAGQVGRSGHSAATMASNSARSIC